MRRNKTLQYLAIHDVLNIAGGIAIYAIMAIIMHVLLNYENAITFFDMWLTMIVACGDTSQSYQKYIYYKTFSFSRRKFYREQCILSVIRSILFAIVRTWMQVMFFEAYIQEFSVDITEKFVSYYPITVIELFLTNMLIYIILNLYTLFFSTTSVKLLSIKEDVPVGRHNISKCMKKVISVANVLYLVIAIIVSVLVSGYYGIQLSNPFSARAVIFGILVIVCIAFYLVDKKRFTPKHI